MQADNVPLLLVVCFLSLPLTFFSWDAFCAKKILFYLRIMTLPLNVDKWCEAVKASDECLSSPASAKNVEVVLSKSRTRGAQKVLCSCIEPFTQKLLMTKSGLSILSSLVKYGTPRTVNIICGRLLTSNPEIWTLDNKAISNIDVSLTEGFSALLEAIVYREDCNEANCLAILAPLSKKPIKQLFQCDFTLPASGYLLLRSTDKLHKAGKDKDSQEILRAALTTAERKPFAVRFVGVLMQKQGAYPDDAVRGEFVYSIVAPTLGKPDGVNLTGDFFKTIVLNSPPSALNMYCETISSLPDLYELSKRHNVCDIVAHIIGNATDTKPVFDLLAVIFKSSTDIDELLRSKKVPPLRLLASLYDNKACLQHVLKSVKGTQEAVLRGAKVKYLNATAPKPDLTRNAVMEKLTALRNDENNCRKRKRAV
ncbi:hypothetical protein AGDE_07608 [Angomonas deanei]|uniref:Uncharacterized protein n=1 Tax=Angomonas deanei TaxID=59799 RepID=A0A7G2CRF2_9TRYP|nr:hypothetical protein AGDE_07608 [Angomonas deanei]CAD2221564.1 hypothetical protein, conserved [Angomonas deanei]|eukprot:EPY35059.1 hypothetical protein AGDE_07608 [Angomonas deanei]